MGPSTRIPDLDVIAVTGGVNRNMVILLFTHGVSIVARNANANQVGVSFRWCSTHPRQNRLPDSGVGAWKQRQNESDSNHRMVSIMSNLAQRRWYCSNARQP